MLSYIPFFRPGSIDIGPLELQPFGILVATGVLLGAYLMHRWSEANRLDGDAIRGLINWVVISGFIGAHVFDVFAYQFDELQRDPLLLFKVWQGISSYGGFIGGAFGFFLYTRRHKLDVGAYADATMVGLVPGFTLGRLGCTVVHDHIGARADEFFLATHYSKDAILKYGFGSPPGALEPGLHHNLGFYEFLYMLVLCALLYGLSRWRSRPAGLMAVAVGLAYAPVRFVLDGLRVNADADPRYAGLTFAQWMSLLLIAVGLYLLVRLFKQRDGAVAAAEVKSESAGTGAKKSPGKGKARKRRKKA